jgi:chorismate lyase / 3-hydroxybenzoate synthase
MGEAMLARRRRGSLPSSAVERVRLDGPAAPGWVSAALGIGARTNHRCIRDVEVTAIASADGRAAWFEAVVVDAGREDGASLERAVAESYAALAAALTDLGLQPVRFWNYIPAMTRENADGLNRYMRFNAGRETAWQRCAALRNVPAPAATAADNGSPELRVQCLALPKAGRLIENPRQLPVSSYSRRFGPVPPRFARATLVPALSGRQALLISGTGSVVGEDSRHLGDATAQAGEILCNLEALLAAACVTPITLKELRIYAMDGVDLEPIASGAEAHFPGLRRLEWMRARLCRRELLLEMEGVAFLD